MQAGRELDAMVSEKVMGWKPRRKKRVGYAQHDDQFIYYTKTKVPRYSTDIAAAWSIVGNLMPEWKVSITWQGYSGKWFVELTNIKKMTEWKIAEGESAPHAICLAALKAVGAL